MRRSRLAAKTARRQRPSSFPKSNPLRRTSIWIPFRIWIRPVHQRKSPESKDSGLFSRFLRQFLSNAGTAFGCTQRFPDSGAQQPSCGLLRVVLGFRSEKHESASDRGLDREDTVCLYSRSQPDRMIPCDMRFGSPFYIIKKKNLRSGMGCDMIASGEAITHGGVFDERLSGYFEKAGGRRGRGA